MLLGRARPVDARPSHVLGLTMTRAAAGGASRGCGRAGDDPSSTWMCGAAPGAVRSCALMLSTSSCLYRALSWSCEHASALAAPALRWLVHAACSTQASWLDGGGRGALPAAAGGCPLGATCDPRGGPPPPCIATLHTHTPSRATCSNFAATELRMLRGAVSNFYDMLALATRTMEMFPATAKQS